MNNKHPASFEIIDIVKIKRSKPKTITTTNKFCHVLSCRTKGACMFQWDKEVITAACGDVLFIPASAAYTQNALEAEEVICFHLSAHAELTACMHAAAADHPEMICGLFQKAEALWNKKEKNYRYHCLSILYEILAVSDVLHSASTDCPEILRPAIQYMNNHMFDTDFSLEPAYQAANISRPYFNRCYKNHFHTTPTAYIHKMRINKAAQLLKTGLYSNEEIARLCGFEDIKYFYVLFKRMTGKTTKEYKSQVLF